MTWFNDLTKSLIDAVLGENEDSKESAQKLQREAQKSAPIFWLVGKTGAGKSSIVSTLTGDPSIALGEGFAPCTSTAAFYDFPPGAPLVRFLDTRGLEEVGYDPADDLAWCQDQAHVVIAVMSVSDPAQDRVIDIVGAVRRQHPNWPVVVAQTTLHHCYPLGLRHPEHDHFTGTDRDDVWTAIPDQLRAALAHQRGLFAKVPGPAPIFVPLDFTRPDDGYNPQDFGVERLLEAISEAGLAALANLLRQARDETSDDLHWNCHPLILGYAAAAAGGAAVPIPYVDFATIAVTNSLMLRALGGRYDVSWTAANLTQFFGAIGLGTLAWWAVRYGLRELLKIIPVAGWAAGAALNCAAAFSLTAGIGEAACVWLGYMKRGETAPDEEVRHAFKNGFARRRPEEGGAS